MTRRIIIEAKKTKVQVEAMIAEMTQARFLKKENTQEKKMIVKSPIEITIIEDQNQDLTEEAIVEIKFKEKNLIRIKIKIMKEKIIKKLKKKKIK